MIFKLADIVCRETAVRLCNELPRGNGPVEACSQSGPGDGVDVAGRQLVDILLAHPLFRLVVQPRAFSPPRLRLHAVGTHANPTIDDAIVDSLGLIRADVTICVFLNDPSEYDEGELVINAGNGDEVFKESIGTCIIYPSAALRRVEPVKKGNCWTAELHAQSLIRGQAERQILYDIGCASHFLETFGDRNAPNAVRLHRCREQLLRMWAET